MSIDFLVSISAILIFAKAFKSLRKQDKEKREDVLIQEEVA